MPRGVYRQPLVARPREVEMVSASLLLALGDRVERLRKRHDALRVDARHGDASVARHVDRVLGCQAVHHLGRDAGEAAKGNSVRYHQVNAIGLAPMQSKARTRTVLMQETLKTSCLSQRQIHLCMLHGPLRLTKLAHLIHGTPNRQDRPSLLPAPPGIEGMPTHANMPIWSVTWFHVHLEPRFSRFSRSSLRMEMMRSAMPLTSTYHCALRSLQWRILDTSSAPCSGGLEYIGRAIAFIWDSTADCRSVGRRGCGAACGVRPGEGRVSKCSWVFVVGVCMEGQMVRLKE
eukprot:359937-Chlamydomonas_euryale.AAC.25